MWLDIGAGSNILIKEQPGAEYAVGVDIERWETVYRNERYGFCEASGESLPFKANIFDFVTSRFTFEHLERPGAVLQEVSRVLKPGGVFIMQTTNKNNPLVVVSRLIPFRFKKALFAWAFKGNPSGTFRAFYRINTPRLIKLNTGSLNLERIILIEDILCQNAFFHSLSILLYRLMESFGLESLRGNMIAVYRKISG